MRTISATTARRLAITRQRLVGQTSKSSADSIFDVVKDLGFLQLDPTNVVAPSHQLVVFSRVGPYQPKHLETLLWDERRLFESWAHAASIVVTEHYPIYRWIMHRVATGKGFWHGFTTSGERQSQRVLAWMKANDALRRSMMRQIRERGPLPSRAFEDRSTGAWRSSGWNNGRNVGMMLFYLQMMGQLMVAGRSGGQKLWDRPERCLPTWTPKTRLGEPAIVRWAAEISLRALGVASPTDIREHFIRWKYVNLPAALAFLEKQGRIEQVTVRDGDRPWPGTWYVHADDHVILDRIEADSWSPRTTLLSPFDNLIIDRRRTRLMFGFDYTMEIYVPAAKRRYGYYAMPVLHEDRLVARIDPAFNRDKMQLSVRGVSVEPGRDDLQVARATRGAIAGLATFLGARAIDYDGKVPSRWRRVLSA
ncbi:MAG: winged helix-turn-helix domain-containing protein [Chloroflexi bacterium]|nr:MAG: winged helix-turn-helix domain-containing protein [Chloroflexota bacterium]